MSKDKYGVHIAHCCYIHGCKYGDEDCPVASGEVAQKHLCWDCSEEYEPYTLEEIEMLRETKSYRPSYKQLKEKVADLEAKLAESEIKVVELRFKQLQKDAKKYENADKELLNENINLKDEVRELKQQLAEKNKEIEINKNALKKLIKNCDTVKCEKKISFAVEQLEKVKELLYPELRFDYSLYLRVMHEIDNQIKLLKEGN